MIQLLVYGLILSAIPIPFFQDYSASLEVRVLD